MTLSSSLERTPYGIEAPKRFDIGYKDYLHGLRLCFTKNETFRDIVEADLEDLWSSPGLSDGFSALSVRTAFDAFLSVLRLPFGTHVLMSAITIPDMVKIVEAHGLVPIIIDVDFDTMTPRMDLLEKAISPSSKVIVVSHVFGTIFDMDPIIMLARQHGIAVVEDCAEAYCGPEYRGHQGSDISLFSFGSIKTETALGGALMRIRDPQIKESMRTLIRSYPVQDLKIFSKRLVKYMSFSVVVNQPKLYEGFVRATMALGRNHTDILLSNTRGFADQDLFQGIRQQATVPMLYLLKDRLPHFNPERLEMRRRKCALVASLIKDVVQIPGYKSEKHYYWLFPICVNDPESVRIQLLNVGFDATRGTTSLVCINDVVREKPVLYTQLYDPSAPSFMHRILYLPIDADTPESRIRELAQCLIKTPAKL